MEFIEKDLEQIIFESENVELRKRNLEIYGKKLRQVKIGNYGIADLITVSREYNPFYFPEKILPNLVITIYEFKKETIGISAFLQAIGYAKGIQRYFELKDFYNYTIRIVLIGKKVDTSGNFCFIPDILNFEKIINFIDFYTYSYKIDGLFFEPSNDFELNGKEF